MSDAALAEPANDADIIPQTPKRVQANATTAIIVTYHTGPALWLCIDAVLAQEPVEQLIIVDNGNPKDVQKQLRQLRELRPRITLLQGQGNIGFGRACNMAVSIAEHPMLAIINPDCLLPEHAVAKMIASMRSNARCWLAGAKLMHPNGAEQRGSRRQLLTPSNAIIEGAKLHRIFKRFSKHRMNMHEDGALEEATEVPAISGAFMMISREHYRTLEGMDDGFFLHVEDLDLCYRVHEAGGSVLYVPDVEVTHFLSTSKVSNWRVERFKALGFVHYFRKHFGGKRLNPKLWPLYGMVWAQFAARMGMNVVRFVTRRNVNPNGDTDMRRLYLLKDGLGKDEACCFGAAAHLRDEGPVLVTGATSSLGLSVMRHAIAGDLEVVATHHKRVMHVHHASINWIDAHFERGEMDLSDIKATSLVHCAPIWFLSPAIIERCHQAGIKHIIAFSSTSIDGKEGTSSAYERDIIQKLKKGEQLLAAECDLRGMQWTILRPTMIYGHGLDGNISQIKRFMKRYRFFPILQPASGKRQPVHVDDLAKAAISMMGRKRFSGKTYQLSGGEVLTYREMLCRIAESVGVRPRLLPIKFLPQIFSAASLLLRKPQLSADIARRMNRDLQFSFKDAQEDFGYQPRNFDPS